MPPGVARAAGSQRSRRDSPSRPRQAAPAVRTALPRPGTHGSILAAESASWQHARSAGNDACPCGSGRKYKQCCEGKTERRSQFGLYAALAVLVAIAGVIVYTFTSEGSGPAAGVGPGPRPLPHGAVSEALTRTRARTTAAAVAPGGTVRRERTPVLRRAAREPVAPAVIPMDYVNLGRTGLACVGGCASAR